MAFEPGQPVRLADPLSRSRGIVQRITPAGGVVVNWNNQPGDYIYRDLELRAADQDPQGHAVLEVALFDVPRAFHDTEPF